LLQTPLEAVAAGRDDDHVRVGRRQLLPLHPVGMLAGLAEEVLPARQLDQLGHPVAASHQRLHPFDEGHAGALATGHADRDGIEALLHARHQGLPGVRYAEGLRHARDLRIHVRERVGPERDDLHRPPGPCAGGRLDVGEAHRAYLAMVLGDDDGGLQRLQRLAVDAVDREALAYDVAHARIDVGAGAFDLELRRRQRRQLQHVGRIVAFVAAPDEAVAASEGAHDLGGAGDQADDAPTPSPRLRGEGRSEGQTLALAHEAAPHPNPLPCPKWAWGERTTAPDRRTRIRRASPPRPPPPRWARGTWARPPRRCGTRRSPRRGRRRRAAPPAAPHRSGAPPASRAACAGRGTRYRPRARRPPSRAPTYPSRCPTAERSAQSRCPPASPRDSGGCPPGTGRRRPWPRSPLLPAARRSPP